MKSIMRLAAAAVLLVAASPIPAVAQKPDLDGTWLFDVAQSGKHDDLGRVWSSIVKIKGDHFSVSKLWGNDKDLTGRIEFDASHSENIDLVFDELTFTGTKIKVPAATYRGLYKVALDRVTICFAGNPEDKRPEKLSPSESIYSATLVRAPSGFKEFPMETTVRVTGPDGKPVGGADVGTFMVSRRDPALNSQRLWSYHDRTKTGPDGTVKIAFRHEPLFVRNAIEGHIALSVISPAKLASGEFLVKLVPEHHISGRVIFDESKKAGVSPGKAHVQLFREGEHIAQIDLQDGGYDFPVLPGTYTLTVDGEELEGKTVTVVVPADKAEVAVGTLAPKPSAFALLRGRPAPEFVGVTGWKGKPIKLADLKGQYVLVDFWGCWCGACIEVMPVMIELHEKFAGKGLAIISVHVDFNGQADTVDKLDRKIMEFSKNAWNGKKLTFPIALVSGKQDGGAQDQYSVEVYPTTILIDPEGKVVGKIDATEIKPAIVQIEKLLNAKK